MRWAVFSLFLGLFQQACPVKVPTKENLCGLLVDLELKEECLQCFHDAGPLQDNPEEFRQCVAGYLPPKAAECAVPHHEEEETKMAHYKPSVHHNHTNANLLPNCLTRRMRELSRYLKNENMFAKQSGAIVKSVVNSNMIPSGGVNMLNIISQQYILCIPAVKKIVKNNAASCLDGYDYSCNFKRSLSDEDSVESEEEDDDTRSLSEEEEEDDDTRSLSEEEEEDDDTRSLSEEEEEDEEEIEEIDEDDRINEKNLLKRTLRMLKFDSDFISEDRQDTETKATSVGNELPYGGTNQIAQEMIMGKCIIDILNEKGLTLDLISIIAMDEFFYPIPNMWAEPILRFYKNYRENLESRRRP